MYIIHTYIYIYIYIPSVSSLRLHIESATLREIWRWVAAHECWLQAHMQIQLYVYANAILLQLYVYAMY